MPEAAIAARELTLGEAVREALAEEMRGPVHALSLIALSTAET